MIKPLTLQLKLSLKAIQGLVATVGWAAFAVCIVLFVVEGADMQWGAYLACAAVSAVCGFIMLSLRR